MKYTNQMKPVDNSYTSRTDSQEPRYTVLVADDDAVIRAMLTDKLEQSGFSVISAQNGEQAWELANTHTPRVVILDWVMPKMDGLTVCRKIKATPSLCGIQVIVLTARGQDADHFEIQASGANLILVKPISLRILVEYVRQLGTAPANTLSTVTRAMAERIPKT